jgi:hypothetical protein
MTGGLYLGKSAFLDAYLPSLINVARFEQPVELDLVTIQSMKKMLCNNQIDLVRGANFCVSND